MVNIMWAIAGTIVAICVAVLVITLVSWAIIAIGIDILRNAGRAKVQIKWLERLYGKEKEKSY